MTCGRSCMGPEVVKSFDFFISNICEDIKWEIIKDTKDIIAGGFANLITDL